MRCVLGRDSLLSQCLSPPRCINVVNGTNKVNARGGGECNGLACNLGGSGSYI